MSKNLKEYLKKYSHEPKKKKKRTPATNKQLVIFRFIILFVFNLIIIFHTA